MQSDTKEILWAIFIFIGGSCVAMIIFLLIIWLLTIVMPYE